MKKRKKIYSVFSFLLAGTLCLSMAACGGTPTPTEDETTSSAPLSGALPVKALQPKHVDENPYMAKSDANIHHDGYNTDSTDEILPLGIYPEINVSFETTNPNASPAIYFDNYGHAVVPLLGGIAIRDLNATETKTLGYFSPMQHDGGYRLLPLPWHNCWKPGCGHFRSVTVRREWSGTAVQSYYAEIENP